MDVLGERLISSDALVKLPIATLEIFCNQESEISVSFLHKLGMLRYLSIFVAIACISSIWCKMLTVLMKQNESFDVYAAMFEAIIIFASFYLNHQVSEAQEF